MLRHVHGQDFFILGKPIQCPERGDFLPPVPLPRRMFAGKRVTYRAPLLIGDEVRRESTIQSVTPKTGRSGQMVFVTVKTDIVSPRGVAITEEQDIVYREEPDPNAPPAPPQRAPGTAVWKKAVTPDVVMLFRYSALTFNGHRIHYDHPYVTNAEGYPALVINGGLIALMLVEAARPTLSGTVAGYDARAMAPMFIGNSVKLSSRIVGDTAETWAESAEGGVHYRVNISLNKK